MAEDEEKSIHEVIHEAVTLSVNQAMKPVYWGIGGTMFTVLLIFVTIAWSVNDKVYTLNAEVKNKIDSNESYRNFLTKNQYFYLDKEEHKADIRAINDPRQCHNIYTEHILSTGESLEIRYRSNKLESN